MLRPGMPLVKGRNHISRLFVRIPPGREYIILGESSDCGAWGNPQYLQSLNWKPRGSCLLIARHITLPFFTSFTSHLSHLTSSASTLQCISLQPSGLWLLLLASHLLPQQTCRLPRTTNRFSHSTNYGNLRRLSGTHSSILPISSRYTTTHPLSLPQM